MPIDIEDRTKSDSAALSPLSPSKDPSANGNLTGASKSASASSSEHADAKESTKAAHTPFSVFTTREKWVIIALAALAAVFSPLTANSYFPAIGVMADAFHTSVELINVTVTVYMFLQGITPMIWGTLSDRVGRRPMYLTCLALLTISCVGMALIPTNAYWLLVVLRCFQAAGSASTVALGKNSIQPMFVQDASVIMNAYNITLTFVVLLVRYSGQLKCSGTISDIAEPSERGGFLGLFGIGLLVGPCIGPIFGGLLADNLGWRSIFWFLCISAGTYCIILLLVFPETLRVIVGDGSIRPPPLNRPLIPIFTKYGPPSTAPPLAPKKFVNPLLQFTYPSVVLILLFNGMVYTVFYGVTATLSTLFTQAYPSLTETDIGLCFLAPGAGCALGSYMGGRILDADFRWVQKRLDRKAESSAGEKGERKDDKDSEERDLALVKADFPIEYARLRGTPIYLTLFVAATIGYGWSIEKRVHVSCPLILQFIIGLTIAVMMNNSQTLLLDLFPAQGSSITAANNLVRCTMGATLVSIISIITRALTPGWTYVLLAGLCVLMWPMNWAVIRFGPRWRERQRSRDNTRTAQSRQ